MNLHNNARVENKKPRNAKSVGSLLAAAKPGKARIEWDKHVPHFGVRILPSGERRWIVMKRPAGSTRLVTVTLGSVDAFPRRKAEALAQAAIGQLAAGIDPNAVKQANRAAERAAKTVAGHTFLAMARAYIKRCETLGRRPTTLAEYARSLQSADLQPWHARPIAGITSNDVEKLIESVRTRAPVLANRMLEFLSPIFKHALRKGAVAVNPVSAIDREEVRHKEKPRKRALIHPYTGDLSELVAVWRGVETIEPAHHPTRALVQLLILTGVRVGTFARAHPGQQTALTWRHVKDLDKPAHARLEIPPELRKTGGDDDENHIVPLVPAAVAILDRLAKVGKDAPVFTVDGKSPIKVTGELRDELRDRANKAAGTALEHWTPHDLRRSVATALGHLGTPHAVIDEILDHAGEAKAGIRGTYDRSKRVELCRHWLGVWADHLSAALDERR